MSVPSIQRAWPDGRCETVADEVAGLTLQAPNDLTFGPTAGSTSPIPPTTTPTIRRPGRVFAIDPDGTGELLEDVPGSFPNGIAVEADGSIVWVDSYGRGVYRRSVRRSVRTDLPAAGWATFPTASRSTSTGNLWITAYSGGGVDVVRARRHHHRLPGDRRLPARTACSTTVRCSSPTSVTSEASATTRSWAVGLQRVDVGVEGMPLFRGAIT